MSTAIVVARRAAAAILGAGAVLVQVARRLPPIPSRVVVRRISPGSRVRSPAP